MRPFCNDVHIYLATPEEGVCSPSRPRFSYGSIFFSSRTFCFCPNNATYVTPFHVFLQFFQFPLATILAEPSSISPIALLPMEIMLKWNETKTLISRTSLELRWKWQVWQLQRGQQQEYWMNAVSFCRKNCLTWNILEVTIMATNKYNYCAVASSES